MDDEKLLNRASRHIYSLDDSANRPPKPVRIHEIYESQIGSFLENDGLRQKLTYAIMTQGLQDQLSDIRGLHLHGRLHRCLPRELLGEGGRRDPEELLQSGLLVVDVQAVVRTAGGLDISVWLPHAVLHHSHRSAEHRPDLLRSSVRRANQRYGGRPPASQPPPVLPVHGFGLLVSRSDRFDLP